KKAANSYLESISLKEKISDKQGLTDVHHNLAMVYFKQNQYNKSLEYYQKCADYYNNQQDTAELVEIWSNTASVYIAQQKYEEAATLLNQILALLPQYPNPTIALNTQMNLGDLHLKKENYPEALALFQAAFQAAQQQEDYRSLVTVYNFMGSTYCLLKDYAPSIFYYQEALTLSQELNLLYEQNIALFGLYKSYNALGNPNKALDWYEQYISIKDSLYNVATTNRISELQAEYDNLQKEKAIRELSMANNTIALESALKSKQLYLSLLGSALVLCMVGVLWAYRHQRQKALLHQKQMERLLNEQEIQILTAVVEAQHNEQKRVAREIHDTIGSFLATLMYQHEAGKALAINTPYYKKYLLVEKLIQQTSDEVRILASDMTNGKQLNFNLKIALDELVQRIRSIEKFDLEFNGIGNLLELSSDLEFLLYRVAQELLSNTLKHAQATKVILQINPMPSEVILMVEDDGRGFDPNIPPKGLGLNNIRARIASFNGRLHIDSTLKKGTTAIVTIPID
ncbi:MAG: tetratricopeptide repeat protein, partial [Aureispira sp.]